VTNINGKKQAVEEIEKFLRSEDKGILITGTHQYDKHKLVMAIIEKKYKKANILFRTNSMSNIKDRDFLGWCGVKKTPKAGEKIKIGNNYYQFDSCNTRNTWSNTSKDFDVAILYPLDSAYRGKIKEILDDLYIRKNISKIFLVSWTDRKDYNYSELSNYYINSIVYDALEEDKDYHFRVIEFCQK
jgi:hypothetical protein